MFALPSIHRQLIAGIPFPKDFRVLPEHFLIRTAVRLTNEMRGLMPDFTKPKAWRKFRSYVVERRTALGIGSACIKIYEDESYSMNALFHMSWMGDAKETAIRFAKEHGYEDLLDKNIEACDRERLLAFLKLYMDGPVQAFCDEVDAFELNDEWEAEAKIFCEEIFPTLPEEEQKRIKLDGGILMCLVFFFIHNSIALMAYRENMVSLFQRAIAGGEGADDAMCKAVRVDSALSEHPVFMARHLRALQEGDESFLRRYSNTSSPLPTKIRYPGLYCLFATLDAFGMLYSMSAPQLLDLCDHANLDRWENRIEDAGYIAKRKREYLANKFR
jgi:hypothetical protein